MTGLLRAPWSSFLIIPRSPDDEGGGGGSGDAGSGGDGGGSGAGGDGGGDIFANLSADVRQQIEGIFADRTKGLKATNEALKQEKQKERERAAQYADVIDKLGGDEGIARLLKIQDTLSKNEEMQLIADGEHEKVFERRTANLKRDHENQMAKLHEENAGWQTRYNEISAKLQNHVLGAEVLAACQAAGITGNGPQRDVRNLANQNFTYDPDRDAFVMKDQEGGVVFGKSGSDPLTISEWLRDLEHEEEYSHWWPGSTRTSANGMGRGGDAESRMKRLGHSDMSSYRAARRAEQEAAKQGY